MKPRRVGEITSQAGYRDEIAFDDDLGKLIRRALEVRVANRLPHTHGRERLVIAARRRLEQTGCEYRSARDDFYWSPPQRRERGSTADHDLWSALIHARDSLRLMVR